MNSKWVIRLGKSPRKSLFVGGYKQGSPTFDVVLRPEKAMIFDDRIDAIFWAMANLKAVKKDWEVEPI